MAHSLMNFSKWFYSLTSCGLAPKGRESAREGGREGGRPKERESGLWRGREGESRKSYLCISQILPRMHFSDSRMKDSSEDLIKPNMNTYKQLYIKSDIYTDTHTDTHTANPLAIQLIHFLLFYYK